MIVIDTNVMSELMRPTPSAAVVRWVVQVGWDEIRTTSITRAEVLSGISILPPGRRRQALEIAASRTFANGFDGHILAFDAHAADHYADIIAMRRRLGRSTASLDMMIAAIARSVGASVATRNVDDFEDCGIQVRNPWTDG